MDELIASTGEMGSQLLAAAPDLANRAAAARTNVAHPGTAGPGTLERHWIGEALVWVMRVHLLVQLGVSIGDLSATVTAKPGFRQILEELSALPARETGQHLPANS